MKEHLSGLPACSPYVETPEDRAEQLLRKQVSRRRFLEGLLGVACAASVAAKIDAIGTEILWPPTESKFSLIPGAETIAKGGEEWLVLGGLGQQDSSRAALEFFGAQGKNQAVSSVYYSSQGIDASGLATLMSDYIREREIRHLSVVGVSMGMPTFLLAWRELKRQTEAAGTAERLPKIERMVAYSSPFDIEDAWRGELAHLIASSGYKGDLVGKFAISMVDGPGDLQRSLPPNDASEMLHHMAESWSEMVTTCPPKLYVSQLDLLDQANIGTQWKLFEGSFAPDAQFAYCAPNNVDNVVYDSSAADKYTAFLDRFDIVNALITVPDGGHANTILSAEAVQPWLEYTG